MELDEYTDDTTVDDEYEQQRLDSLSPRQQELAYTHHLDQFESVPSYFDRFKQEGA